MKLFLIFYAVIGLLFIIALCRAASWKSAQELSPADTVFLRNPRLQNSHLRPAQPIHAPLQVNFHQEKSHAPSIIVYHHHSEEEDHRRCA